MDGGVVYKSKGWDRGPVYLIHRCTSLVESIHTYIYTYRYTHTHRIREEQTAPVMSIMGPISYVNEVGLARPGSWGRRSSGTAVSVRY